MTADAEAALTRLRFRCLALPRAAEKLSHGMPCFYIDKGKSFAWFWHDHHGDGATAALVKTSGADEQAMLIEGDPDTYYRPPYFGPAFWVGYRLDTPEVDWDRLDDRVAYSWELVAPKKLLEAGGR